MIARDLDTRIVLAPMAGGPSTTRLAAAVSEAGGLGFVASGYLTAGATAKQIDATRALTDRPFGVNVFAAPADPADRAVLQPYLERLRVWARERGAELGFPRHDDDDLEAKLDLLVHDPVPVVSFTFGCPAAATIARLHAAGSEVWVTVTTPQEAAQAAAAGSDALVVQGGEAGGHRGSFADREGLPLLSLLSLLQLIGAGVDTSLVAAGGIATGRAVAAVLAAGADAAQIGTAFMRCPEAGTSRAHREALRSGGETALTRAFTGRLARGIHNEFMDEHGAAPIAYPEIHHVTAPFRKAARERGEASLVNLWAGETHALAREAPAAEIVREIADEARIAAASAAARLGEGPR